MLLVPPHAGLLPTIDRVDNYPSCLLLLVHSHLDGYLSCCLNKIKEATCIETPSEAWSLLLVSL